jgi:hypothetical protein
MSDIPYAVLHFGCPERSRPIPPNPRSRCENATYSTFSEDLKINLLRFMRSLLHPAHSPPITFRDPWSNYKVIG